MKIGLAIHHHSPGYGGPFTVLSESANYLYKNNIDMRMFFNQNQFSNFNLNLNEIVKSRDLFHLFGIWDPFHIKLFLHAKFNKKLLFQHLGLWSHVVIRTKKIKK